MGLIASLFNFGKQTQIKEQINYNGIKEDELIEFLREFKSQISVDNKRLQSSIEKSVEKIIISKIRLIIVEIYKEHCESSLDKKLTLSLEQIKSKTNNMKSDIQKVITDLQDAKNAEREIKSELNASRKQIEADITRLNQICEDILYNVKLARKILGDKIDAVKELLTNYIKAAELSNERLLAAIQISTGNKEEKILPTHLAMDKIAEMFDTIQKIAKAEKDKLNDIIAEHNKLLQNQIQEMSDDIKNIGTKASAILKSLGQMEMNLRAEIHKLEQKINDWRQEQVDLKAEKSTNPETAKKIQEYETYISKSKDEIVKLQDKLMGLMSNGATSLCPCSYCGYKPPKEKPRMVVDGYCRCEICGKPFIDLNPDMSNISSEKAADLLALLAESEKKKEADGITGNAKKWKKLHTAELEGVSAGVHSGLYRMKLGKYTVSSNGVLIIPNKTWDCKDEDEPNITEIAFCQPNTDDDAGKERLSRVKTLFLKDGVTLGKYEGHYPFDIDGLERVMRWRRNEEEGKGYYEEDQSTYNLIKGGSDRA